MTPFEQTVTHQINAASPLLSAWVGANAGSGKTRVLTNRVARLLLAGANPSRILCITYTKAAAAEMAERLFKLLGEWALQDDAQLADDLQKLEGSDAPRRSGPELSKARQLFARALETPGGLKIQTIHAFCSHVLKRFPLEAGVPPGFGEMEESEATLLIEQALNQTAEDAHKDEQLATAFWHLGKTFGANRTPEVLRNFINQRQQFETIKHANGGITPMLERLADELGVTVSTNQEELIAAALDHFPVSEMQRTAECLKIGTKTDKDFADILIVASTTENLSNKFDKICSHFLTTKKKPRARLTHKAVQEAFPELDTQLKSIQSVIIETIDLLKGIDILQDTTHFFKVSQHLLSHYEKLKWSRGVLDFDDLIIRTRNLFDKGEHAAQWVMYKLDNGLEHILIDEAQDTSPGQWNVIERPLGEFFSQEETRDQQRTVFVVGDEKQSIYSFQGADTNLFREKSIDLSKKINELADFENIPLTLSFRSTAPILNFVDASFDDKTAMEGMGEQIPLKHGVHRSGEAGLVELWPLTPKPEKLENNPWDAPIDTKPANNPVAQLCGHVAKTIAQWLGNDILVSQGRPINPGDIIILVQRRGPLFKQIIKSLTQSNIPVAGADRLALLSETSIQDLLSYARCILLPEDDLSLAETLKSPFFDIDDDNLYSLAADRKSSLWETLQSRHQENKLWRRAYTEISTARKIALTHGPYDLYVNLLDQGSRQNNEQTGRQRLYSRLGSACGDPINAFIRQVLDYEAKHPRNLQAFVTWFEDNAGELKRELDQESNAVRIMTVHGAKGLEGNIVFLLDAHERPSTGKLGPLYKLTPAKNINGPLPAIPAIVRSKDKHTACTNVSVEELKENAFEEYRRLFYVAATRAKDRLYICGLDKGSNSAREEKLYNDDSWYNLAEKSFDRLQTSKTPIKRLTDFPWEGEGWHFSCAQTVEVDNTNKKNLENTDSKPNAPDWLTQPCPCEKLVEHLSPSTLADYHEDKAGHDRTTLVNTPEGYSPVGNENKFLRGRTLHRLLELLPDYPQGEHSILADRIIEKLAPELSVETKMEWRDEALRIIGDINFAPVFTQSSRAEVSIGGTPPGARAGIVINGQIDRLAINGNQLLIVDYKTNQPPPLHERDVADAYLAQMAAYRGLMQALYPDKTVKAGLLWTYEARLMMLSDKLLDHAFSRFLT